MRGLQFRNACPCGCLGVFGASLCLVVVVGCRDQAATLGTLLSDSSVHRWDAGRVTEGDAVSHDFIFRNECGTRIFIANEASDIRENCGCAGVEVDRLQLNPRESARIRMNVNTSGRQGDVDAAAKVTWSTGAGETLTKKESVFVMKLFVQPALVAEPKKISFGEGDVLAGRTKTLRVTSLVDVDWNSLRIETATRHFNGCRVESSESGALVHVTCVPEGIQRAITDSVILTASSEMKYGGEVERFRATVPLCFRPDPKKAVSIHPSVVAAKIGFERYCAEGKFLAQTEQSLRIGDRVSSVTCDDYEVDYRVTSSSAYATLVEFALVPRGDSVQSIASTELEVSFANGPTFTVPVSLVGER